MDIIFIIHTAACVILLGDALTRIAHSRATAKGLYWSERWPEIVDALGWGAVTFGVILASPLIMYVGPPICFGGLLLHLETPALAELAVLCGLAAVVVRQRLVRVTGAADGKKSRVNL
jgi:hypothetical protein